MAFSLVGEFLGGHFYEPYKPVGVAKPDIIHYAHLIVLRHILWIWMALSYKILSLEYEMLRQYEKEEMWNEKGRVASAGH